MKDKVIRYSDQIVEFCLYFLIFCLPFAKAGVWFFLGIAILAWMIKKVGYNYKQLSPKYQPSIKLNKPLLAFVVACGISTILSVNFSLSFKALFTKILKYVILYFIIVETINDKHRLRNILIAIIISASLIAVDSAIQYSRGVDFLRNYPKTGHRLRASFGNPNSFGGWLIVVIPIFLGVLLSRQFVIGKIKKIALGGFIILLLIYLGNTYSRSSWIGFALSLGLIFYYLIKLSINRFRIFVIIIIILSLVGLSFILPPSIKIRIGSIGLIENTSLLRINLWKESLGIIEDFPVFGIGLNTYAKVGPYYAKSEGGGFYPHNSYLHMAAEIGIIGLFSFLWIIINLFRCGIRALKSTNDSLLLGLLAAIVAFLTQSFFDVNFYALQLATLFWFVLGLTMARINILTTQKIIPA